MPFYVRVGKCLPVTATEVLVRFKRPQQPVLDDPPTAPAGYYRFRLNPEVVLAVGTKVKRPGDPMVGAGVELVAHYQPPDEMAPYERLLGDASMATARCSRGKTRSKNRGGSSTRCWATPATSRIRAGHVGPGRS